MVDQRAGAGAVVVRCGARVVRRSQLPRDVEGGDDPLEELYRQPAYRYAVVLVAEERALSSRSTSNHT